MFPSYFVDGWICLDRAAEKEILTLLNTVQTDGGHSETNIDSGRILIKTWSIIFCFVFQIIIFTVNSQSPAVLNTRV